MRVRAYDHGKGEDFIENILVINIVLIVKTRIWIRGKGGDVNEKIHKTHYKFS